MSYDFCHPPTAICRKLTGQSWAKALELARLHGWRPIGTQPPSPDLKPLWDGGYLTNDGQTVTAKDAISLAAALERSLDDIPDTVQIHWNPNAWIEYELPEWLSPEEKEMIQEGIEAERLDILGIHPHEFFAGDEKCCLIPFIRFCRLGSFIIS